MTANRVSITCSKYTFEVILACNNQTRLHKEFVITMHDRDIGRLEIEFEGNFKQDFYDWGRHIFKNWYCFAINSNEKIPDRQSSSKNPIASKN